MFPFRGLSVSSLFEAPDAYRSATCASQRLSVTGLHNHVSTSAKCASQCLLRTGLRNHVAQNARVSACRGQDVVLIWMMYFNIWMLCFLVMEPFRFMCPVLVSRPGLPAVPSRTLSTAHFLCLPFFRFLADGLAGEAGASRVCSTTRSGRRSCVITLASSTFCSWMPRSCSMIR